MTWGPATSSRVPSSSPRPSYVRKGVECADTVNDGLRNVARGVWIVLADALDYRFQMIGGFACPPNRRHD